MKQDVDGSQKALAEATASKANAEGQVALCEQDIKTAKEYAPWASKWLIVAGIWCRWSEAAWRRPRKRRKNDGLLVK